MNADYKIGAIKILLNEECILKRYYSLIPYKNILVEKLSDMGCHTKSDCMKLSDKSLLEAGLPDEEMVKLFRAFLGLYDINKVKLKEIDLTCRSAEEKEAFLELYQLPGVKCTRATLYYKAGFRSLDSIAHSSAQEIITKTESIIQVENMDLKIPLIKEVKTHIAVARAFTDMLDFEE